MTLIRDSAARRLVHRQKLAGVQTRNTDRGSVPSVARHRYDSRMVKNGPGDGREFTNRGLKRRARTKQVIEFVCVSSEKRLIEALD